MSSPLFDLYRFIVWLRRQPAHHTAGYARCTGRCPLAEYAIDALGCDYVVIQTTGAYTVRRKGAPELERGRLPGWALRFMEAIDRGDWRRAVSVAECLRIAEGLINA